MRALKWLLLALVLLAFTLVGLLAWLGRSEDGSRWLVENVLARLPFSAEVEDVRGTLTDGLAIAQLNIELPVARIAGTDIRLDWQPAGLLTGRIVLDNVQIGTLAVDVLPSTETAEPDPDLLFWLRAPVDVVIRAGRIDALRIQEAEFTQVETSGAIGWSRLRVDYLAGEIAGVHMRLRGGLAGASPGRLTAQGDWRWPAEGLAGAGQFSGSIEDILVNHLVRLPEPIRVRGAITNLFSDRVFSGTAQWDVVRLPGATPLHSRAGAFRFSSDFTSVLFSGKTVLQQDGLPEMRLALAAEAGLTGLEVRAFALDAFGGQLTGSGALDYRDGLTGAFAVTGKQLDINELRPGLPGQLNFAARLVIDSPTAIGIDVSALAATLSGQTVTGTGRAQLRDGQVVSVATELAAGRNRLNADLELQPALRGTAKFDAPKLAGLHPELQGQLTGQAVLTGTLSSPRARITAAGSALQFRSLRAADLDLDFELTARDRLNARLRATGLMNDDVALGELQLQATGSSADHSLNAKLAGGVAEVELAANGGWDGSVLSERLTAGSIRQPELGTWRLANTPRLRIGADRASVDAHCWKQQSASLCVGDTRRSGEAFDSSLELSNFPLATFAPLLPTGLSVSGVADSTATLRSDATGWRGKLRWRQRDTLLTYLLEDGDTFSTTIDSLNVDLDSAAAGATLTASIRGDQGLMLNATGQLAAPLGPDSALVSQLNGEIADISILRPWLLEVVDVGSMEGMLSLDMQIAGTPRQPVFSGGIYLREGLVQLPDAGVTLADIDVRATSAGSNALNLAGNFRSGQGTGEIGGAVAVSAAGRLLADITVNGTNLQTIRLPQLSLESSPDLAIRIDEAGIDVSGSVAIPAAVARIRSLPGTVVQKSADVIVHATERVAVQAAKAEMIVTGDVNVVLGDNVRFYGFGLESRLDGSVRLRQQRRGALRGTGTVRVRDGFLMGYGKELRVDRGTLNFTGPLDDPGLNVQVSRNAIYEGRQYTVGLRLTGTAQNVVTTPFSRPSMSERDVLAFLLLDRPASSSGEDTDLSGAVLAMGLGKMLPGGDGGFGSSFGLDEVSFEGSELEQTSVVAGKRITDDLYIRYAFGLFGEPGSFRIRYLLGRGFSVESSTGENQAVDLIYVVEKD